MNFEKLVQLYFKKQNYRQKFNLDDYNNSKNNSEQDNNIKNILPIDTSIDTSLDLSLLDSLLYVLIDHELLNPSLNCLIDRIINKIISYPNLFLDIRYESIVDFYKNIIGYEILTRVKSLHLLEPSIEPSIKISISTIIEILQYKNKTKESQKIQKSIIKKALKEIEEKIQNNISTKINSFQEFWFNISPDCLEDVNFVLEITDFFNFYQKKYNILLGIEITEKCKIDLNYSQMLKNLEIIKKNNIKTIMDDFGTDLNNINFMLEWEWDVIKINGKLVNKIKSSISSKELKKLDAIFKALLTMINSLKSIPVCEWVETEYQYEILKSYGYTYFQGYLFNPPP